MSRKMGHTLTLLFFLIFLVSLSSCLLETPSSQATQPESIQLLSPVIKLENYNVLIDGYNVISIISDEECDIYYTLDESIPSKNNGILYNPNEPIIVDSDVTINAIATKNGMKDSPISTEHFYQLQSPVITVLDGDVYMVASIGCDIFYTSSLSLNPSILQQYITNFNPKGFNGEITYGAIACKNGFINSLPTIATFEKLEPPTVTLLNVYAHSGGSSKKVRFNCSQGNIRYTYDSLMGGFITAANGEEKTFSGIITLTCSSHMSGKISSDSVSYTF